MKILKIKEHIEQKFNVLVQQLYYGIDASNIYGVIHVNGEHYIISRENDDYLYVPADEVKHFPLPKECTGYKEILPGDLNGTSPILGAKNYIVNDVELSGWFKGDAPLPEEWKGSVITDTDEDGYEYRKMVGPVYVSEFESGNVCKDGILLAIR